MAYTTIDDPTIYFNTKLTTGTGSSQAVTGLGFQPDWIWGKRRDSTGHHTLFDSVRGITKGLETTSSGAEFTSTDYYSSFDSDGFTIAAGAAGAGNGSSQTAVQWCWKAGTSFTNDASSTSVGSIDSAGSVNTTAGFSIITYTGTGSAGTIAHGLGAVPGWYMIKRRNSSEHWQVYHKNNTSAPGTDYLQLSTNEATVDAATRWNDTVPTSTVFSVGAHASVNADGSTYVAYCFAEKKGYSKFGSYTGNGSTNGPFIYTGMKPSFVMVKNTGAAENWIIFDNKRPGRNLTDALLKPNLNNAESASGVKFDLLSNGFKARVSDAEGNSSGGSFIYMAFSESPFVNSNGIPNNAR